MTRYALLGALLVSTSCLAHGVRGSGKLQSDVREVQPFTGVSVASGIHVVIELGPPAALRLEGDDNLIALVETVVDGHTLEIRFRRNTNIWNEGNVTVHVRMPEVRSLQASGGSEIRAEGGRTDELELEASGGGQIFVRNLDAAHLSASSSGGAHIELAGRARRFEIEMSGGAKVIAGKLNARSVKVDGSGGAHAEVTASDSIRGNLSGGSDVRLHGNASSRVSTSGGAEVAYDDDD